MIHQSAGVVSAEVLEMPLEMAAGTMPHFPHILDWLNLEVEGLDDGRLDFDDCHPDREWMWWSIRRQVSHIAWDVLVLPWRRCRELLWPDGNVPNPIVWEDHQRGPNTVWDRVLDETRFWSMPDLLAKVALGLSWLDRVVTEQSIETLRNNRKTVTSTYFWEYVITTLPRGAISDRAGSITYDLEGTLWMGFYEAMTHVRTIQRLKEIQGLPPVVELPRVGYLSLPEYWGDAETNGPSLERLKKPGER